MEGYGFASYWGFSPCLDLQKELSDDCNQSDEVRRVNILLMGCGDIRHVFKTVAEASRHPSAILHFCIIEASLETLARHILFFKLICEPFKLIGMQGINAAPLYQRCEMYLELFGNTFLRPITAMYLEGAAQELILMITDLEHQADKLPFLDLSQLTFKERDVLEQIFKRWKIRAELDMAKCWDIRVRQHLKLRYDSRDGAFDWDYNMKLIERGGEIVHMSEYKKWRRTGIAFELRDADYTIPNYTLLSPIVINDLEGDKHARLGYWGDIVVGPFIAFGIESEEQSLFKKTNRNFEKKSQDVSLHNLISLFYELCTHQQYQPNQKEKFLMIQQQEDESIVNHINKVCKITLLPSKWAGELHKKTKFEKYFNLVVYSNSMNHFLTPQMTATFEYSAKILMETIKFLLDLKKDNMKNFEEEIYKITQDASCQPLDNKPDSVVLRFIYKPNNI